LAGHFVTQREDVKWMTRGRFGHWSQGASRERSQALEVEPGTALSVQPPQVFDDGLAFDGRTSSFLPLYEQWRPGTGPPETHPQSFIATQKLVHFLSPALLQQLSVNFLPNPFHPAQNAPSVSVLQEKR